ncbi:MAG: L-lactate dehydrogenase [Pseudomonadota bacterium]|nr:L-lactate dehydrogenase [Pseudomonadota bacterium]
MATRVDTVRVAVVGAGHVGATFAFALVLSGVASDIVLVDADTARAEGEAMDLDHAIPYGRPARVHAGGIDACAGADVVVLTAGAGQSSPGETRLDLAARNVALFRGLVPEIARYAPDAVLVVATNPVDVLTLATLRLSGFPPARVIGSGTILDTARLRFLLGRHFGVEARSVHANVVGEHGDSEVVVWSTANIAGVPIRELCHAGTQGCGPEERAEIARQTRDAAYDIIQRKGHTAYAIGAGLVRLVEAVVRDQKTVLSVSTLQEGPYGLSNVCLSLPTVIGRGGAERVLPLPLEPDEQAALLRSAATIREAGAAVGIA